MDVFGETKSIDSKNGFEFNLRFAGQYYDDETGYHYNYHRYYDPNIGRYLTSDPIGLNGGSFNTYAYVDNEVWRAMDPWGLYTVFIGGAADAEPFLGQGPTKIMNDLRNHFADKYLQPYFEKAGYSQDRARQLASRNARYYGFHELHLMLADAKMYLSTQGNENAKISIVGHSLGGWQAAHLAQQLEEWRCGSVGVVTTLDPVGVRYSYNLAGSINFKTPNPKYKTWVNIRAEAKDTSINDVIANLGGQWDPSSLNPTYNYTLEVDHAYARTMFTTKIPNQNISPIELVNRSYLNNQKKHNRI
ncbi:hypothetical protein E6P70_10180 [Moraxella nonliquefaciens]|uniref:RHS repeat-associated core domain-containing protein n=1 Tax=Moraxella nonliquefaciens TaxID=478 RepID=UPI0024A61E13|nr:RHS repeat-associated core domain-containing protein [Moraxella nonliquefaciens]MDI4498972.1 hypothetical protein [Moraxella nonliquefaciens]MDI4500948.1 hypothetical protein [Moraxella nonliquefaciens]